MNMNLLNEAVNRHNSIKHYAEIGDMTSVKLECLITIKSILIYSLSLKYYYCLKNTLKA